MRNIVLCGFMGCGKTTVGHLLAEKTGRRFVDMDAYIEEKAGMDIPSIFRQYGEADFRRREQAACRELAGQENLVIATGGGALTNPLNAAVLAETGDVVYLTVSPETVLRRLSGDTTRPLLARPDREAAVRELLAARDPLYRRAASLTADGELPPAQAAEAIARLTSGCR